MQLRDIHASAMPLRKKKFNFFSFLFFFIIFAAAGAGLGYYLFNNTDRFLFYFQENKYSELDKEYAEILNYWQANYPLDKFAKVDENFFKTERETEFLKLVNTLIEDFPADGYLFYLKGMYHANAFLLPVKNRQDVLAEFFFNEAIERPEQPPELDYDRRSTALLALRKAIVLGLPEKPLQDAKATQAALYFWGGGAWWGESQAALPDNAGMVAKMPVAELLNILSGGRPPNWKNLETVYPPELTKFWQALYYLQTGNLPLSFAMLSDLTQQKSDIHIHNYAAYLLGKSQGKYRQLRQQLFYYRKIELEYFMPRNPWFLSEYTTLLRFLGDQQESTRVLSAYESKYNGWVREKPPFPL